MIYASLDDYLAEVYCHLKEAGYSERVCEVVEKWFRKDVHDHELQSGKLEASAVVGMLKVLELSFAVNPDISSEDEAIEEIRIALREDDMTVEEATETKQDIIQQYLSSPAEMTDQQRAAFSLLCNLLSVEYHYKESTIEELTEKAINAVARITKRG